VSVELELRRTPRLIVTTVKGQPFPSLINVTIDDLQRGLDRGLFTSVDLVNAYLARIAEVNPRLNAVTEINPDALTIAADLDGLRAKGKTSGPLHGIPILIKNNIATKDKMNNTAGSYALLGTTVPMDSFIARKLREAGAIILGKANLSQWANYRSSNSSNGWSAYGGQVYGAYYPGMDPSGSSSGSAVASSVGLALASLGTEVSPCHRTHGSRLTSLDLWLHHIPGSEGESCRGQAHGRLDLSPPRHSHQLPSRHHRADDTHRQGRRHPPQGYRGLRP